MLTEDSKGYQHFYTFSCDECGDTLEVVAEDMKTAALVMRGEGWRIVRDEDLKDFYHYCPNC